MEKMWTLTFLTPLKNQNQAPPYTTPRPSARHTGNLTPRPSRKDACQTPAKRQPRGVPHSAASPPPPEDREILLNKVQFHMDSRVYNNVRCKNYFALFSKFICKTYHRGYKSGLNKKECLHFYCWSIETPPSVFTGSLFIALSSKPTEVS